MFATPTGTIRNGKDLKEAGMAVWMVRAGKHGEREDMALSEGVVSTGFKGIPDISAAKSRDEVTAHVRKVYPELSNGQVKMQVAALWMFRERIKLGDLVALPFKSRRAIAVGEVASDYVYRADRPDGDQHTRNITWLKTDISYSLVDGDILKSLRYSASAVSRIRRKNAEERIRAMASPIRHAKESACES